MSCEVNLLKKFLLSRKVMHNPHLQKKWARLNIMISGQWLLTACGDLWIPYNLHFCCRDDGLPLHGVCEHLERTDSVIRILLFYYLSAFNTVQPHKSECQRSINWILRYLTKLSLLLKGNMTSHQITTNLQTPLTVLCFLVYLVHKWCKTPSGNEPYAEIFQWNGTCQMYF